MTVFASLFGRNARRPAPELLSAVERAVTRVEPLLKTLGSYPEAYLSPVSAALEYAHKLAQAIPGPLTISRETYASDPLVHALFPSVESVTEAMYASRPLQEHLSRSPADRVLYALMGMRRSEKTVVGMQLAGEIVQQDVVQKMVYFTSHTIDFPSTSEEQARKRVAMHFFDRLVDGVALRVAQRRQEIKDLLQQKDMLAARLRGADSREREELERRLDHLVIEMQVAAGTLELERYPEDFTEVLLSPEQQMRLKRTSIRLDGMGIRRDTPDSQPARLIAFDDLIGYDRRTWTVTLVRCSDIPHEEFSSRLERAWRSLAV